MPLPFSFWLVKEAFQERSPLRFLVWSLPWGGGECQTAEEISDIVNQFLGVS